MEIYSKGFLIRGRLLKRNDPRREKSVYYVIVGLTNFSFRETDCIPKNAFLRMQCYSEKDL